MTASTSGDCRGFSLIGRVAGAPRNRSVLGSARVCQPNVNYDCASTCTLGFKVCVLPRRQMLAVARTIVSAVEVSDVPR